MNGKLLHVLGILGLFGLAAPRPSSEAPTPDPATPSAPALLWTQDVISWTGGNWDDGVQTAANWIESGYVDWRLPTVEELQAALQNGTWGQDTKAPGGSYGHWTSKSQGIWAYKVTVTTDANGNVVPSLSGEKKKVLKSSNLYGAKFVRP